MHQTVEHRHADVGEDDVGLCLADQPQACSPSKAPPRPGSPGARADAPGCRGCARRPRPPLPPAWRDRAAHGRAGCRRAPARRPPRRSCRAAAAPARPRVPTAGLAVDLQRAAHRHRHVAPSTRPRPGAALVDAGRTLAEGREQYAPRARCYRCRSRGSAPERLRGARRARCGPAR